MARTTLEEVTTKLEAARSEGHIWNVDYVILKDALGRHFDAVDTAVRDTIQDALGRELAWDLTNDFICSNYSNFAGRVARLEKKLAAHPEALAALQTLVKPFLVLIPLVVAVKPLIEKGRKPAENPSLNGRTIDHTGTCGCCGRNIKLNEGGRLWDHGYTIDGRGRGIGSSYKNGDSCFGVGYEPIEVSCKVWIDLLANMEARLKDLPRWIEKAAAYLKANPKPAPETMRVRAGLEFEAEDLKAYRATWNTTARGHLDLKLELAHLDTAIPALAEKILTWVPQPLPGAAR